jgi:hypothetical protein
MKSGCGSVSLMTPMPLPPRNPASSGNCSRCCGWSVRCLCHRAPPCRRSACRGASGNPCRRTGQRRSPLSMRCRKCRPWGLQIVEGLKGSRGRGAHGSRARRRKLKKAAPAIPLAYTRRAQPPGLFPNTEHLNTLISDIRVILLQGADLGVSLPAGSDPHFSNIIPSGHDHSLGQRRGSGRSGSDPYLRAMWYLLIYVGLKINRDLKGLPGFMTSRS